MISPFLTTMMFPNYCYLSTLLFKFKFIISKLFIYFFRLYFKNSLFLIFNNQLSWENKDEHSLNSSNCFGMVYNKSNRIYFASCWLDLLMSLFLAHAELYSGLSSNCAFLFPIYKVVRRISFISIEYKRLWKRYIYYGYWKFRKIYTRIKSNSFIYTATRILGSISVSKQACLFISF